MAGLAPHAVSKGCEYVFVISKTSIIIKINELWMVLGWQSNQITIWN